MFVPLSLPLGEEELGLLPTCYTQGTASIIVICSSEWLRHAAILGPIPGDVEIIEMFWLELSTKFYGTQYSILSRRLLLTPPS